MRGLGVDEQGRLVRLDHLQLLRARLTARIRLYRDEWFLSPSTGVDWWSLRGRLPDEAAIRVAVRRAMAEDPEVRRVESVSLIVIDSKETAERYNSPLRWALIRVELETVYGAMEVQI